VALAGFTVFYGLERAARRGRARTGDEPPAGIYWFLAGLVLYAGLLAGVTALAE
jgi:hypothetical protein